ncbi:MAG: VanZ family protein [Burkholderiales bacterium]|nr:VanZ family protein [Burkholderiales bacterium]
MHKTAASPLALMYAVLIVYASLYPFAEWRNQDILPWAFLEAPFPRYWTRFDVAVNIIGYLPLGSMLALSALRSGRGRQALWFSVLLAAALSLGMETLQSYLPARVPSREDWLLNTLGASLGAVATVILEKLGGIYRWSRFRARWFVPHARGGLVLLATWPMALLFPAAVPFGLGQVFERIEVAVADRLADTPFLDWLPVRDIELQPLVPGAELACVALGLLIPCLLGFCIIRSRWRRAVFVPLCIGVGVLVTGLSAALSWGPTHAWAWLDLPTQWGIAGALVMACAATLAPWRVSAALALLALGVYLSMLNQAPESAYFSQTLQAWEQGQFIRFHGLAQWLGWLWPYATLLYVLTQIGQRGAKI